jgi:flagellar basal-body rod modification protein FlgD
MTVAAATSSSGTTSSTSSSALTTLSSNFDDFLQMLMTQLKNQDPTSPLDTNQFTSELVQFSGVEQQINTNSALTQLISLTQSGEMVQASSMMGKTVQLSSSQMPLQDGSASLAFTATTAGTARITVANSSGTQVYSTTVDTTVGTNNWTWNGKSTSGVKLADGAYTVSVTDTSSSSSTASLGFTVSGKVTGVVNNSGTLELELGSEAVPFSSLQSVSS